MTDQILCKSCKKPKAPYECGLCHEYTCKSCTQFMTENFSAMRKPVPEKMKHSHYCMYCFDAEIAEPLTKYTDTMEKAKDIILYSKEQTKLTRLIKYKAEPYLVEDCEDEEEAVMRMSFWAVEDGCNCLIHLQYDTKKKIVGSHKKTIFSATAIPVLIDPNSIRGHVDPP